MSVLIDLIADNASYHGCSRGNSWDNLTSNHLCLVAIGLGDLVVAGAQVRACCDEIDMEVAIIIFFEVSWLELRGIKISCRAFERLKKLSNGWLIVIGASVHLRSWTSSSLSLLSFFRCLNIDNFTHVLGRWKL